MATRDRLKNKELKKVIDKNGLEVYKPKGKTISGDWLFELHFGFSYPIMVKDGAHKMFTPNVSRVPIRKDTRPRFF